MLTRGFTLRKPKEVIALRFGVDLGEIEVAKRDGIVPGHDVLTISRREGSRQARSMRWGVAPPWSRYAKARSLASFAAIEASACSPIFATPLRRWRCLVPADGFYVCRREPTTSSGRKWAHALYHVTREDGELFAFAGLYAVWRERREDDWSLSCALLTEPAHYMVERFQERMPVILHPLRWDAWMDPTLRSGSQALEQVLSDPSALHICAIPTSRARTTDSPRSKGDRTGSSAHDGT